MFISKMALPRRTFLRGFGTTLALPLLDAMIPAATAMSRTAARPIPRLGFFYVANGCTMRDWHPSGGERDFDLSPILRPLEAARSQMVVVAGLANAQADTIDVGSGPHTRCHSAWLNGTKPKRTEGADIEAGTTIDQYAAKVLGTDTPLLSLEMALEAGSLVGNCDNGYACVYKNTFSWRTPTIALPMEHNPRVVFERLFGDGSTAAARAGDMRKNRSILDAVTADMGRLQQRLGPGDRLIVTDYLDAVRQVESSIQRAERRAATAVMPSVERPAGVPNSNDEHARLMLDLQFLGYQADVTRVVSFQFAREESQRTYPQVGVPNGHHDMSHHKNEPERMGQNTKINTYHVSLFAYLVEKMRTTPDGDGSLLDHAMLLYGSGMGDGDQHNPHDLPVVIVGGGCGRLTGGRYVKATVDTPMMNLGLSLLDKVGVELDRIGDSTGRLAEL